ncbi:MAG: DUF86 domain-containing protein [Planctomycetes bacterium]|nr:DUF86 domain-containing protein [Planctomycetota bacterium]
MTRSVKAFIQDIVDSIERIESYCSISREEFVKNIQIQDAVIRRLEIIGEAVKSIPDETRNKKPEIPWKKMAGLRDMLAHVYFGITMERIWIIAKNDLPKVKEHFKDLLK